MAGPRTYVSTPTFTPLPFGLLSSLASAVRSPSDPHWQSGVNWEPICAQGGTTYDECFAVTGNGGGVGTPPPAPLKTPTASVTTRGATAFTVYTEIDCSAPGFWDRADELLRDTFTQSEQWQVENALWTGAVGGQSIVFPRLAANAQVIDASGITLQTAATAVSGLSGPLDVVEGLGALEAALGDCYDGVGVIHAPRSLLAPMLAARLVVQEGPRYRTGGGNIAVFGTGYRGTSPSGASVSGQSWMYATGAMFIYRSPMYSFSPRESFDRSKNTLKALAERNYLVGWDCCHLGVNISTGGIITGAVAAA